MGHVTPESAPSQLDDRAASVADRRMTMRRDWLVPHRCFHVIMAADHG
jgi:hypothetical protein